MSERLRHAAMEPKTPVDRMGEPREIICHAWGICADTRVGSKHSFGAPFIGCVLPGEEAELQVEGTARCRTAARSSAHGIATDEVP